MLIFASAIFQNFSVSPPEGKKLDLSPDLSTPFFHTPRKHDVVLKRRTRIEE